MRWLRKIVSRSEASLCREAGCGKNGRGSLLSAACQTICECAAANDRLKQAPQCSTR
jgi:hypothetical protein